jgi:hypothetical protein
MTPDEIAGPIEAWAWPTTIIARVVDPSAPSRIHGYEVVGDLARHHRGADLVFLALTGELPDDRRSRAFEIASIASAPSSVAEPPAHAASLAAMCGGATSAVLGVTAIALAEEARVLVETHRGFFEGDPRIPREAQARDAGEREAVAVLRALLPDLEFVARLDDPSVLTCAVAIFVACGLGPAQVEAALVFARLPTAVAEGLATPRASFASYPMDTPRFVQRAAR